MKVLVYIETKEGAPVPGSLELLTAAKELGETVVVAAEDKAAAEKAAAYGAKVTVLIPSNPVSSRSLPTIE